MACALCAAVPLGYLWFEVARWVRNVPHWDEFDTVLAFLLSLDTDSGWAEFFRRCLEVNNEHRMFVSRLIFATSYWLFGSVNFTVLAVIGNLFLVGAFVLLLSQERFAAARLRLAAVFGLAVFHLQHHESLFWAGSSIDHFLVVLAAVAALGALATSGRTALLVAIAAGMLGSFSLAHGLLIWPIGLGLLALQRRRRAAAAWSVASAVVVAWFFVDFDFNPGHKTPGFSDLPAVILFALRLVGSSASVGNHDLAPWMGALILAGAAAAWRGSARREWLAFAIIAWCLAASFMIAWGRALLSNEWAPIASRYVILGSISWALLLWVLLERILIRSRRPRRWVAAVLGPLLILNVAANATHASAGRLFAAAAENAVRAHWELGSFARAVTPPYPDPERADALVRAAASRGIYQLPARTPLPFAFPREMPVINAREIGDAAYFIEDVSVDAREVRVRGWAFRNDETSRPGDIAIVFRASDQLVAYEASPQLRPDVAESFARWDAIYSGFELRLRRERLPAGTMSLGIGFELAGTPEYMMTAHTVANSLDRTSSLP